MKKLLFYLALTCMVTNLAFAQNVCPPSYTEFLDVSKVRAQYWNGGDMFWDLVANPSYVVPYDPAMSPAAERSSSFAAAIWMGGLDDFGQLRVAAQTYRQSGLDFFPGPHKPAGSMDCGEAYTATGVPLRTGLLKLTSGHIMIQYYNGFDIYNPVSNTTTTRILPPDWQRYNAVQLQDGRLLLYGGENAGAVFGTNLSTFLIDPATFVPLPGPDLLLPHYKGSAVVLPSGEVIIVSSQGAERYDPVSNTSTLTSAPTHRAYYNQAILLSNGLVWNTGGHNTPVVTIPMNNTGLYDPATDTWTTGPIMPTARMHHTMFTLPSGEVLLIGGNKDFAEVESYDPVSNTFSPAGSLVEPVAVADAVPYAGGSKLLVGSGDFPQQLQRYDIATGITEQIARRSLGHLGTPISGGLLLLQMDRSQNFCRYDPLRDEIKGARYRKIWKIDKSKIDQFITDQAAGTVDFTQYPDIETWPGNGNVYAGEDYHMAPFVDVNNDGKYRPEADGDYPCINGDQALWWVFHDDGDHTETGGERLNVQVKAMAYAYDCDQTSCLDTNIEHSTFLRFEVVNKSGNDYHDYYFGYWMDGDIGSYSDDYVGCDTNLNLGFTLNGDAHDETAAGYGINPPALGVHFLKTPENLGMTNFVYYENDFSLRGNPEAPTHYYGYMQSYFKDGSHMVDNGLNGYAGTAPGPPTNYVYPGDAGWCGGPTNGWSELTADGGNTPFDRRMLLASGPIEFPAGDTLVYDIAIVWARGFYNDNKGSVCELQSITANLSNWWTPNSCLNVILNETPSPNEGANLEFEVFPNPSTDGSFTVKLPEGNAEEFQLSLLDLLSRNLTSVRLPKGTASYTLEGLGLADGIYFVKLESDSQKGVKRVLVQK